ncbi:CbtB domain-containing protein [Prauserella muralis]|uniref:Uncharacterized protein n=1 Tax=Prauserella muralis TaxID=588067 RepID=A0A2V4B1Y7_9PSEU|nr:CbtB-domain containing protein [Prauserella muralis]PXY28290.1 hypothetical protein BAY60_18455 [Prauserella muralis]TWE27473.1 putative cobalt transporter subunit CbtB [Prauserella muralis]
MTTPVPVSRSVRTVPLWAWLLAMSSLLALYLVLQENGMLLGQAAEFIHEFVHDGRHALGVPCH